VKIKNTENEILLDKAKEIKEELKQQVDSKGEDTVVSMIRGRKMDSN
jgi:hypothetical protein